MAKPKINLREAKHKLAMLLADGRYHKARTLAMNNRSIRDVCQHYPEEFLSTQRGYKLVAYCTDDEINEAAADLKSRAMKIYNRAQSLEDVMHKRWLAGRQPGLEI